MEPPQEVAIHEAVAAAAEIAGLLVTEYLPWSASELAGALAKPPLPGRPTTA